MRKTTVVKTVILLAAFVLQFSLVQRLTVFGFTANLCVLALIGVSYFSSPAAAAVYGGVLGLAIDGAAGRYFGVSLLLCMYLAVGVKLAVSEKINNSPAIMAAYAWLFTFAYYIVYGLFSLAVPRGDVSVGRWLLTAAVTASLNFVVALPSFWLADRRIRGGVRK